MSFKKFLIESFLLENRAWHGFIRQYGPDILKKAGLHKEYEAAAGETGHGSPEHLTNFLSDNLGMKDLTPEEGRWIFKNFHRGGIQRAEDIEASAIPSLMDLRKAKENGKSSVDLSSINSLKDLNGHLNKVFPERALKDFDVKPDEFTVHAENEHWQLIQPKSKNAACAFGRGSGWCTVSTGNTNMFKTYDSMHRGVYILLPKNPQSKNEKYQFSGHPNLIQFMDKNDEPIAAGHKRSEAPNFGERPLPEVSDNPQLKSLLDHAKELDAHHQLGDMSYRKITRLNDGEISKILDTPGLHSKINHINSSLFAPKHIDKIVDIVHNHVKNVTEQNLDHEMHITMLDSIKDHLKEEHIDKLSDAFTDHLKKAPISGKMRGIHPNEIMRDLEDVSSLVAHHELFNPFKSDRNIDLFLGSNPSAQTLSSHVDKMHNSSWDIQKHHIDKVVDFIQRKDDIGLSDHDNTSLADALRKISYSPNFSIKNYEKLFDERMRPTVTQKIGDVAIDHIRELSPSDSASILDETSGNPHSTPFTRKMVLTYGNINFDHINQGLKDGDQWVRSIAAWRGLQPNVEQGYDLDNSDEDVKEHRQRQREHLATLVRSNIEGYHLMASQAREILGRNQDLALELLNNSENRSHGYSVSKAILERGYHRNPNLDFNSKLINKAKAVFDNYDKNRAWWTPD